MRDDLMEVVKALLLTAFFIGFIWLWAWWSDLGYYNQYAEQAPGVEYGTDDSRYGQ